MLAFPASAVSQTLLWSGFGQNTADGAGLDTGETLTLGLSLIRPAGGVAGSVGVPADRDAGTTWGMLGGWFDMHPPTWRWGVAAGASLFAFDDPILDQTGSGSILALDSYTPVEVSLGEVRFRLGARHGARLNGDETSHRFLGRAGTEGTIRAGRFDARAEADYWWAEEGGYPHVAARVGLTDARVQAWAAVAHWLDDALPTTGWDVGAVVPVTPRLSVIARGGVQAEDLLFQIPAQRTWSVAVQLRLGRDPLMTALPPAVLVADQALPVTLTLSAQGLAGVPGVAGSFSGWEVRPMELVDGRWQLELRLEPGVYEYSFVTANGQWFVPDETPGRKPDGFGGHVAVVIVQ
jgi:hypothetical protein